MSSIFTKIIQGDIPCHKIAEDDQFFAFLDIRPIAPGHTLIVPKVEIDRFFDLDNDLLSTIMPFAKPIATAIEAVVPCDRVGLMVAGLEVPHAHLHLVPIQGIGDLNFTNAKPATNDALAAMAKQIIAAL
jgi:histidine triad (HIT) family protein